jgi:hypothetical protein
MVFHLIVTDAPLALFDARGSYSLRHGLSLAQHRWFFRDGKAGGHQPDQSRSDQAQAALSPSHPRAISPYDVP